MKEKFWNFFEKHFGLIVTIFVAFDFGFMGYDIRLTLDGSLWGLAFAVLMAFWGFQVLGTYKRHHERKAEKAGANRVYTAWGDSIGQRRDGVENKGLPS